MTNQTGLDIFLLWALCGAFVQTLIVRDLDDEFPEVESAWFCVSTYKMLPCLLLLGPLSFVLYAIIKFIEKNERQSKP